MTELQPSGGFTWVQDGSATALICTPLAAAAPHHLYTTRSWRLGSRPADAGWDDVARAVGVEPEQLVRVRQVHGAAVIVIRQGEAGGSPVAGDADILTTDDPGRAIAVQAADCAPILMADRRGGAVAAAHAGWRGLAAGVPGAAVRAMRDAWGSRPADLVAAIGPCIGPCCYEVGADVREAFDAAPFVANSAARWFGAEHRPGHWHFDPWGCAGDQLAAAGVPRAGIHVSRLCTRCAPEVFCSYRADGAAAGRMAGVIRPRA